MRHLLPWIFSGLVCRLFGVSAAFAADSAAPAAPPAIPAEHAKFFETKVRPLLAENCQSCHGEKKQKGGLRLDSAEGLRKGGKDGPVVVPGKPAESKLIIAVSYQDKDLQMPPDGDGDRLSPEQVSIMTQWIAMGAPWGTTASAQTAAPVKKSKKRIITDEDRKFWSFQPPRDIPPPDVDDKGWCQNAVDRFVFAKLAVE
jgi:hypothetical protein